MLSKNTLIVFYLLAKNGKKEKTKLSNFSWLKIIPYEWHMPKSLSTKYSENPTFIFYFFIINMGSRGFDYLQKLSTLKYNTD